MTRLTLYSRRGCHLCDDMIIDLEVAGRGRALEYEVVDIDSEPELAARYGSRVPVLTYGEVELCEGHLDIAKLNKILKN